MLLTSSRRKETAAQQRDLAVFREVVLQKEGRLDLHGDKEDVLQTFKKLDAHFSKRLSLLNQFRLYATALSKIKCGHTQIHPNKEVFRAWLKTRNSLPIDMYLIGKRLVVNKLLPQDVRELSEGKSSYESSKKVPAGSEILSIDGETVYDMMNKISRFLSSDEDGIDFKYFQAAQLFDFFRHLSGPFDQDSIQVKYVYELDTTSIYLQTGTAPVHTMNKRLTQSGIRFKQNETGFGTFKIADDAGYFRFTSFKSAYGKKYNEFLEASFRKLKRKKIDKLIIDVRGNTGGAMQYALMRYIVGEDITLGRYLVEKPKRMFESRHLKKWNPDFFKHRRVSKVQKRLKRKGSFDNGIVKTKEVDEQLIYDGEIVVITDEGTFSSAAILACHLKTLANAKIIGRTAGGSFYAGNAGTLVLELPESKLKMFVNPNTFYSHLDPVADPFAIKQPDIVLNPLLLDYDQREAYYLGEGQNAFK